MILLRRALVVGLLAASVLLGGAVTASAQPVSTAAAAAATDVFSGTVALRHPGAATKGGKRAWDYTVTVQKVFTGDIDTRRVQVRTLRSFAPCAVTPLSKDGVTYTFRVVRSGDVLRAPDCSMIAVATDTTLARLTGLYGEPHDPVQTAQPSPTGTVELSPRDVATPASFSRVAAPGLAVIIIALLGLFLVRRLNRTRLA